MLNQILIDLIVLRKLLFQVLLQLSKFSNHIAYHIFLFFVYSNYSFVIFNITYNCTITSYFYIITNFYRT